MNLVDWWWQIFKRTAGASEGEVLVADAVGLPTAAGAGGVLTFDCVTNEDGVQIRADDGRFVRAP